MSYSYVLYDVKDGLATITMDRPDVHNAFNEDVIQELDHAFATAGKDASVRVVVLRGNGKSFCAGGDLNWMRRVADYSYHQNVEDAGALGRLLKTINLLPKPTIALVHGNAYGGGVGLAACCDIVIATEDAKFCLSEVRIGIIPSIIAPYVINAIGQRQARRYFMTAERITAPIARDIGLAHEVVADTAAMDAKLDEIIAALWDGGPAAQARGKRVIHNIVGHKLDDDMIKYTVEQIAEARASDEGKEGLTAFLNKTEPGWRNRT